MNAYKTKKAVEGYPQENHGTHGGSSKLHPYSSFGFQKILGLGHFLWIPLLPVVLLAIPGVDGGFRLFLVAWTVATTIFADVWMHFTGAKQVISQND
ncbi:MAG: hypothetical protein WD995_08695 [Gemmatimonadota bacterium]